MQLLPLFPLRGRDVLFPGVVKSLVVKRNGTIAAVNHALANRQEMAVFAVSNPTTAAATEADLERVGTNAAIVTTRALPNGLVVTLSGIATIELGQVVSIESPALLAKVTPRNLQPLPGDDIPRAVDETLAALDAFCASTGFPSEFRRLIELAVRPDVNPATSIAPNLTGVIINYLGVGEDEHLIPFEDRQALLAAPSTGAMLKGLVTLLRSTMVKSRLDKHYLDRVGGHIARALEIAGGA